MKWFKIYGQKWLLSPIRWELTHEQRAIWVDILARASLNEPPGQIGFYSLEQLAHQFNVDIKLLSETIKRLVELKMIKFSEKKKKIVILNWKKYQSEYERQKTYRKANKEDSIFINAEKMSVKNCNKVTLRIEENNNKGNNSIKERGKENNLERFRDDEEKEREKFLELLKGIEKLGYPYNEAKDSALFYEIKEKYPKVNIIRKTKKKIEWWKKNPKALHYDPRKQLRDWFKTDYRSRDSSIFDSLNPDEKGFKILNQYFGGSEKESNIREQIIDMRKRI